MLYEELPDTSEGEVVREERGYERGADLSHALPLKMLFILLGTERCLVLQDECEIKPDKNRRGYDCPVVVSLGAVRHRRWGRIPQRSGRSVRWGE